MNTLKAGYVYVIHFCEKFHHAEHYIGCTRSIKSRLTAHANGLGSNLIAHHMKNGGQWQLASLYNCTIAEMRKIERSFKNVKNGGSFCSICSPSKYMRPENTLPIDVRLLNFPTHSFELRRNNPMSLCNYVIEKSCDANYLVFENGMRDVEKMFKEELGFIPNGGKQGIRSALIRGHCYAAFLGNTMLGYCYFSQNPEQVTILQVAVRDEYQRNGIGKALVNCVRNDFKNKYIIAKVRSDLPANLFWTAIGMTDTNVSKHITSESTLIVYRNVDDSLKGAL